MAYSIKTWVDRESEFPNRRTLTPVSGQTDTVDVARAEGTVSVQGDAFDAANMNDLESRISAGFAEAQPAFDILPVAQGGTGQTTLESVTVGNALKLAGLLPSAFTGSAANISSGSLLSWAEAQESSTGLLAGGSEVTDLPVANAFFSGYLLSNSSSTKFLILFRRATAATQNLATIHINTFNLGAWNGWVEINANTWGGYSIWKGTQAQYDALSSKSSTTLYFIVG